MTKEITINKTEEDFLMATINGLIENIKLIQKEKNYISEIEGATDHLSVLLELKKDYGPAYPVIEKAAMAILID